MDIENIIERNSEYSELFADLGKLLFNNESLQFLAFDEDKSKVSQFIDNFTYNVSPWPIIIDERHLHKFNRIVDSTPPLLNKVLKAYIAHEPEYLKEYINISSMTVERYKEHDFSSMEIMSRYDAVETDGVVKLVEINIGSSLGGWWSDWLYPEISQKLETVESVSQWNFKYRKISELSFKAVWQSIARIKGNQAQGNIFIYIPDSATTNLDSVHRNLHDTVMRVKPKSFTNGTLHIFDNLNELEWLQKGQIKCRGFDVDALLIPLMTGEEINESFFARLQAYAQHEKFYYPDSELYRLLANKLLFALLHDQKTQQFLTDVERQFVQQHIPWSGKLNAAKQLFKNQHIATEELIERYQSQLVFKKSESMQGKDVIVGKSVSKQEWLEQYQVLREDNDWLIQWFCEPDVLCCADQRSGLSFYRIVWGIFGVNGKYGGSWCRGNPLSNNDTVINLARGAVEFVVAESQPQKRKITL